MMARQHVALGYAGYIATVSTLGGTNPMWANAPHVAWLEPMAAPIPLLLASVIAAGFSIWPDIDHPNATITKKLGFIGSMLSIFVRMFTGHRGLTHTWVFVVANAAAVAGLAVFVPWVAGVIGGEAVGDTVAQYSGRIILAILLAISALIITKLIMPGDTGKGNVGAFIAAGLVALAAFYPNLDSFVWLPLAVGAGVFLHDVGDALTVGGVKFFAPFKVKIAIPLVGKTNSWIERLIAGPIFTFTIALFTLKTVIFPLVPAIEATLQKIALDTDNITLTWTMIIVLAITAFDFVTRVITGKPQFSGH